MEISGDHSHSECQQREAKFSVLAKNNTACIGNSVKTSLGLFV